MYEDPSELQEFRELDSFSMKQWMVREKMSPIVQRLMNVENRGLFGVSNADFSFMYNIPEMAFNFYEPGLKADHYEELLNYNEEDTESDLYTFPGGMYDVVTAIEKKLNDRVQKGAEVTRVSVNKEKTVTVTYKQNGKFKEVKSYSAILATPAPVTASIVKSGLSGRVINTLASIQYTTYVTMALYLSERVWNRSWNITCLDTPFSTMNDAIRTQVKKDHRGKSILGIALPPRNANDRTYINMSDTAILNMVMRDVERYFPCIRKKLLGQDIHRFRYAFPVFRPGYYTKWKVLEDDDSIYGPLILAGDYTVYPTLGGQLEAGSPHTSC